MQRSQIFPKPSIVEYLTVPGTSFTFWCCHTHSVAESAIFWVFFSPPRPEVKIILRAQLTLRRFHGVLKVPGSPQRRSSTRVSFQMPVSIVVSLFFFYFCKKCACWESNGEVGPWGMWKGGREGIHTRTPRLLSFLMPKWAKNVAFPLFPPFSNPSSDPFIPVAGHSLVSQLSLSVLPAVDPAVWARWAPVFFCCFFLAYQGRG